VKLAGIGAGNARDRSGTAAYDDYSTVSRDESATPSRASRIQKLVDHRGAHLLHLKK
jgi:hypothetical protein